MLFAFFSTFCWYSSPQKNAERCLQYFPMMIVRWCFSYFYIFFMYSITVQHLDEVSRILSYAFFSMLVAISHRKALRPAFLRPCGSLMTTTATRVPCRVLATSRASEGTRRSASIGSGDIPGNVMVIHGDLD